MSNYDTNTPPVDEFASSTEGRKQPWKEFFEPAPTEKQGDREDIVMTPVNQQDRKDRPCPCCGGRGCQDCIGPQFIAA